MGIFNSWKRLLPWILAGLVVVVQIYDRTFAPIVNLNIENWAASKGLDDELVDGGQQTMSLIDGALLKLAAFADLIIAGLLSQWFLGFVCGAIVFAFWDPIARSLKRAPSYAGGYTARMLGHVGPKPNQASEDRTPLAEVAAEAISRVRGQPGYETISFNTSSTTDELRRMADFITRWHPVTGRIPNTKASQNIGPGTYFMGIAEDGSLVAVSDPLTGRIAFEDLGIPSSETEGVISSIIDRLNGVFTA